jgi:hypothetical protein
MKKINMYTFVSDFLGQILSFPSTKNWEIMGKCGFCSMNLTKIDLKILSNF